MSEELQSVEAAPVSDAPVSEPVTSEQPEVSSDPMEREMAATFDKIHQPQFEDGKWSCPPEYRPEAPPSEAPELEAQEQEQQASEIQPPPNWKSRGDIWSKLPAEAKALVVQREQDFQRGVSQLGEQAKTAREFGQVFEEFREHLPKDEAARQSPSATPFACCWQLTGP